MEVFNKYSELYDLIYFDKDYSKETDYIINIIKQYNPVTKEILEYGSGTGIHGSLLVEKGYNVTGVELSKTMMEKAQSLISRKGLSNKFKLYNEDISKFRINKKFDSVISLFHVISYLTGNGQLNRTFQNASYHLESGGLFIFDIWYAPAVLTLKPQNKIKEFENDVLKILRYTEPVILYNVKFKLIVLDKTDGKVSQLDEIHKMRYFSIPEIEYLAGINSFEMVKTEEFLSAKEPSENTWGVCFILRKR
jgi:predicted TPR repeat methyltransferase